MVKENSVTGYVWSELVGRCGCGYVISGSFLNFMFFGFSRSVRFEDQLCLIQAE